MPRKSPKSRSSKRNTKPLSNSTHWDNAVDNPLDFGGFVYCITNTITHKRYIGRKYTTSVTKKRQPGKKRRVVTTKESNWRTYTGSCKELNADIKKFGKENFNFRIISWYKTRAQVNYNETREQFIRDVLHAELKDGSPAYYNDNILGRYYRSNT